MITLSGAQKRHLRALAHRLKPVVLIGQRGVTDRLLTQVDQALDDHELIKVKLLPECPNARGDVGEQLAGIGAACAGAIGRVLILYRPHPETPVIKLPTKRSHAEQAT